MHGEKTRELPGMLEEPAKVIITKTWVTKEPALHISKMDPEEEDRKISQGRLDFKQTQNNFKIARPFMSSPLPVVGGTRSCSRGPL